MGVNFEQVVDVAAEGEIAPGLEACPALRPDQVERGAGDVFPADDQVGAELGERDPQLGGPALPVNGGLHVPDGVPVLVRSVGVGRIRLGG